MTLGSILGQAGALDRVVPLVAEALERFEAQGHLPGLALCHRYRAYIAAERNQFEIARIHLESSLSLCRALKDLPGIGETLRQLAELLEKQGQVTEALALYREALQFLDMRR
jgi:tetratricopeptide (TPR) repeat protein